MSRAFSLVPAPLYPFVDYVAETVRNRTIPALPLETDHLRQMRPELACTMIRQVDDHSGWKFFRESFSDYVGRTNELRMGSTSDAGWRFLGGLAAGTGARRVLEIGTHLGHGTLLLASIARANAETSGEDWEVHTVDVVDVNAANGPWEAANKPSCPLAQLQQHELESVRFLSNGSPGALLTTLRDERYDLVFIDGKHRADIVYQEIAFALPLLRRTAPYGLIVLDDVLPDTTPWTMRRNKMPGPYLGASRAVRETSTLNMTTARDLESAFARNIPPMAYLSR